MKPRTALLPAAALAVVLAVILAILAGCAHEDLTAPELYSTYCARCHGERGTGKGDPEDLTLYPHLNLLTSPMVRGGDRPAVRQRIREGYGPMPGFARRLTPRELERLVDLTLQLAPTAKEKP